MAMAVTLATGCGGTDPVTTARGTQATAPGTQATAAPRGTTPSGGHHPSRQAHAARLPSAHVHGVAVTPADDKLYLATHDGLFRYDATGPTRVGPVIDLMGFAVAGPDHFYASGHPGAGVDLPEPVGLIESRDGGRTWTARSRQGESDFHALVTSDAGIVGFDGTLRATENGTTWRELPDGGSPRARWRRPRWPGRRSGPG